MGFYAGRRDGLGAVWQQPEPPDSPTFPYHIDASQPTRVGKVGWRRGKVARPPEGDLVSTCRLNAANNGGWGSDAGQNRPGIRLSGRNLPWRLTAPAAAVSYTHLTLPTISSV